jgi:hypothetical protein
VVNVKFKKKPIVIEAVRFMIEDSLPNWVMDNVTENIIVTHPNGTCDIKT